MTANIAKYLNYTIDTNKYVESYSLYDIKNDYTLVNYEHTGPCLIALNKQLIKKIENTSDVDSTYFAINGENLSEQQLLTWMYAGEFSLSDATYDMMSILVEDGETIDITCNIDVSFTGRYATFFTKTYMKKLN